MELRPAYLAMIREFPGGQDAMAAALGYSRDALENRVYERKGQQISVHVALQMQAFSGTDHFAQAVAKLSGGTFVKLPCVEHIDNESISEKFHEIFEELGELSAEFRVATADGFIDAREKARINKIVDAMHVTMDQIRALTFKVYCLQTAEQMKRGE